MSDDDLEFGKSSRSARKGRRANRESSARVREETTIGDDDIVVDDTPAPKRATDGPPKPSRRMSGWGDDSGGSKSAGRRRGGDFEDERLRPSSPAKSDGSDNDIPVIPDLEDQQEEDMTTQIAEAPMVAVNRVATYRELDSDLLRHAAFVTLDNEVDLKLLAKGLSAETDVVDEDIPWDWDRLFTDVSSDLQTEWDKSQVVEQEA